MTLQPCEFDHADAVLGSAAVPRVAYGDCSSLMPLRQAPHRHDLDSSVCVFANRR